MSGGAHSLLPWLARADPDCVPRLKFTKVVLHHQATVLLPMATTIKLLPVVSPHPLLVISVRTTSIRNAHQRSTLHPQPSRDPPLTTMQFRIVVDFQSRPRQILIKLNHRLTPLHITVPLRRPSSRPTQVRSQALRALCSLTTAESPRARWIIEGAPGTRPQIHTLLEGLPQAA
jgi:hypothetical protein